MRNDISTNYHYHELTRARVDTPTKLLYQHVLAPSRLSPSRWYEQVFVHIPSIRVGLDKSERGESSSENGGHCEMSYFQSLRNNSDGLVLKTHRVGGVVALQPPSHDLDSATGASHVSNKWLRPYHENGTLGYASSASFFPSFSRTTSLLFVSFANICCLYLEVPRSRFPLGVFVIRTRLAVGTWYVPWLGSCSMYRLTESGGGFGLG